MPPSERISVPTIKEGSFIKDQCGKCGSEEVVAVVRNCTASWPVGKSSAKSRYIFQIIDFKESVYNV